MNAGGLFSVCGRLYLGFKRSGFKIVVNGVEGDEGK